MQTAWGQSYDVYIENRRLTSDTTMEFDVFIQNTGSTTVWNMRSYQSGYRFSAAFINGGNITASYISGSSDLETSFNKVWGFTWNSTAKVLNQSANTGSSCPGGIISRIPKKIGRFRLRNSVNWGCGEDSMSFVTSGTGFLRLAITKYDALDCSVLFASDNTLNANPYTKPYVRAYEVSTCGSYSWFGTTYTSSGTYTFTQNIPTGCNPITDTLYLNLSFENYWQGSVSSAWENPLNWSCQSIPDSNSIVFIDGAAINSPVISSIAWCKKIAIGNAAAIKVNPGFRLNVVGTD